MALETLRLPIWLLLLSALAFWRRQASAQYLNEWAVEVKGGLEEATIVAKETGCNIHANILPGVYHMVCHHVRKRSAEPHDEAHRTMQGHGLVLHAEQQKVLSRQKRQMWRLATTPTPLSDFVDSAHLNDDRWPQMWYLNRGNRLDMNVQDAWAMGFTGKGTSVTILDDGIEKSHPDLRANYDPMASYDVNQNDNDPTPRYDMIDSNRHGTRCAGEVAATANNSLCAVGIAFNAGIGGVRMLDGDVTDAVEARSLSLNNQHIDIYSASWGPDDDGKTVDGPGKFATRAFMQGIMQGRGGKGSIFVWASGNGGRDYDNCNCDGYTNSVWTLSVSSATENGLIPWYSEACSSTLATTYSSGSSGEKKIVTTDLHHTCTSSHTGTSASAPLAAGIIALVLEANPDLTWRDVQHITVRCAHNANLRAPDWSVNAIGRNFSHSFGYGLMDAACMVRTAKAWKTVPEQQKCSKSSEKVNLIIPGHSSDLSTITVVDPCGSVKYLEHVQASVTLNAAVRGDVQVWLTSPSGTRSHLLAKRPKDFSRVGFNDWPFLTVHMWEESPVGVWTLEVVNDGKSVVELKDWRLSFLGTEPPPQEAAGQPTKGSPNPVAPNLNQSPAGTAATDQGKESIMDNSTKSYGVDGSLPSNESVDIPNCAEQTTPEWCDKCNGNYIKVGGRCMVSCPEEGFYLGTENHEKVCFPCYYSCATCSGPNDYECISCYGDAELYSDDSSQKYCFNKNLLGKVESSTAWYYFLSIGFLVNFLVILCLCFYIVRWKRNRSNNRTIERGEISSNSSLNMSSNMNGRRTSSGLLAKTGASFNQGSGTQALYSSVSKNGSSAVPFRDYESSSEEEDIFKKKYTEEGQP